jgi:predicted nucleic acid-binding protein
MGAVFLDASAIVAYHVDEPRSEILRGWWHEQATKYSSPFCFFESLNVYKRKWTSKKLSHDQYREASFNTYTWYQASMRGVKDINFDNFEVFQQAHLVAMKHSLDVSDAFQILSIRDGYFSSLVGESATILCTGDAGLATAARAENLNVWNFNTENPPG